MTYENWEREQRDPVSEQDYVRVDQHYFGTNPYILQQISPHHLEGKHVLEIGCGAGSAACHFAQAGAKVVAVDITDKAVELTRRHAELSRVLDRVEVFRADAEDLSSIESNQFDLLYSWGVMHHSSNPEACFRSGFEKLKPGAQGLIMVYHKNSIRYWLKGGFYLLAKGKFFKGDTLSSVQRYYTDGDYHKHYSRANLRAAMEEAGFEVTQIDVTHMSSRMIPFIPGSLREWLKARVGWLIVARVKKTLGS